MSSCWREALAPYHNIVTYITYIRCCVSGAGRQCHGLSRPITHNMLLHSLPSVFASFKLHFELPVLMPTHKLVLMGAFLSLMAEYILLLSPSPLFLHSRETTPCSRSYARLLTVVCWNKPLD